MQMITTKLDMTIQYYKGDEGAYLLVLSELLSVTPVNISDMNISCEMIAIVLVSSANQNLFAEHYWVNISYHNICQYHRFYKLCSFPLTWIYWLTDLFTLWEFI